MRRRKFLTTIAGLIVAPLVPAPKTSCDTVPVLLTPGESVIRKKPYLSREGLEDIRNWGVDQIDEKTRRELFGNDMSVYKHVGVNFLS